MKVELDKSQEWRDNKGRIWYWSNRDGWVVNDKARFGGYWPSEHDWPFTLACRHPHVISQGGVILCTECHADLTPKLTQDQSDTPSPA